MASKDYLQRYLSVPKEEKPKKKKEKARSRCKTNVTIHDEDDSWAAVGGEEDEERMPSVVELQTQGATFRGKNTFHAVGDDIEQEEGQATSGNRYMYLGKKRELDICSPSPQAEHTHTHTHTHTSVKPLQEG